MPGELSLNGTWSLTWAEGQGRMSPSHYTAATLRGSKRIDAAVPAPIHQVLQNEGLVGDLNVGMHSLEARWVEEHYWIYRHTFEVPAEATREHAWLTFDQLEYDADIWLNGEKIGQHANAHRPARFDVTGHLQTGENLIVVQLSTGMHEACDKPILDYHQAHMDRLTRRPLLRKPQYQCGWDWHPRLMNVGILGDVHLEWHPGPRLDQVSVVGVPAPDLESAEIRAIACIDHPGDEPVEGVLRVRVAETGQEISQNVEIAPGASKHEAVVAIADPQLWWPTGYGEQPLYTTEVTLEAAGDTQTATRRTGIRRVEIDQSPHPETGRYFIIRVNNQPIFCKGGNWVPADILYSTVEPERYRKLVDLALEANFNTLRVWGGGCFADPVLCETCDEKGVLIWHDFLFACSKYPGDDPAFAAEVRREVTWAVRAMAHHPSIVVWCGNNEIEWGDWAWGYDDWGRSHPHYALFHHDIPKIVHEEHPAVAYWISSPHSPDYVFPNDPTVGDQHPWGVSILEPVGADFWSYRDYVDRFPNEGGVIGVSPMATLKEFLPENQRYLFSPAWDHHDNPFACNAPEPGALGRAYATVEMWLGRDPEAMAFEEYAFASALLQAEGLTEYISNYRRRMFSSSSAIFWMYNDSWPVTHGWTIVDYYLRHKLAYHPVRRAFQPVTVVVTADAEEVVIYGVNDTADTFSGELRYGLFALAGGLPMDERQAVRLEPFASTSVARFPRKQWEQLGLGSTGAFAMLHEGGKDTPVVARHRLFLERFKDLAFAKPEVKLAVEGDSVVLSSDQFAWGVCLDVDGDPRLRDNCFDLLPGVPRVVPWSKELGKPKVAAVGNGLVKSR